MEREAIQEDSWGCDGSVCVVIALIKSGVFLKGAKEKERTTDASWGGGGLVIVSMARAHLVNENNLFCNSTRSQAETVSNNCRVGG